MGKPSWRFPVVYVFLFILLSILDLATSIILIESGVGQESNSVRRMADGTFNINFFSSLIATAGAFMPALLVAGIRNAWRLITPGKSSRVREMKVMLSRKAVPVPEAAAIYP